MSLKATDEIHINPEKIQQLLKSAGAGVPIKVALDRAGIPHYIYYNWVRLYDEYISELENNSMGVTTDIKELEPIPLYSNKPNEKNIIVGYRVTPLSIVTLLKQKIATWIETTHIKINTSTRNDNWQNLTFLLERRVKSEYAKEETINQNTEKVDKVVIEWVDPKQEADRLKKLEEEVKESLNGN